jgi:ribosomal protein L16 Arg81 hydroxylase
LAHAQVSELVPGDAIFIPSMWWHHVAGLESLNILINHWWRISPDYLGVPQDALLHAILSIRDLPPEQREAWRGIFDHYVFHADEASVEHIPADRRGVLGELDETAARKLRAALRNNLNR